MTDRPEAPHDAPLSRRRFLRAGTGTAAAFALGASGVAAATREEAAAGATSSAGPPAAPEGMRSSADASVYYQSFCAPPVEYSRDGVLDTNLRVVEAAVNIREPSGVRVEQTRTYNGIVPGPTLRLRAGDTLNIKLANELPPNPDPACPPPNPNVPHCFNTTNLHTHGLHVSPLPPSDDIFLRLEPGGEAPICVVLPEDHAPGTYWYHAHKHGSTAIQLVNGLAGALIVDDPPSVGPAERRRDRVMVLQEIIGNENEEAELAVYPKEPPTEDPSDVYVCSPFPCDLHEWTVNGCNQPTIQLRPGQIERWRVINATATPRGYTNLKFQGLGAAPEMLLIAVDGVYLPQPRKVSEWLMLPGGRADFLVRFSSGSFQLLREPPQGGCQDQVLANVQVSGVPFPATPLSFVPPAPPEYLKPITDAEWEEHGTIERHLTFSVEHDMGLPCWERFKIDGQTYDPDRIDHQPELGAVEKWIVTNTSAASHPFHIHVNPFQVIAIGNQEIPFGERYWQDTVDLPPGTTVAFYTRFLHYHGKFVLHCHILNHEDWGMMQNVEVVGYGTPPCVAPTPGGGGKGQG